MYRIVLTEIVRHGDYKNVQKIDIENAYYDTRESALRLLIAGSPYNSAMTETKFQEVLDKLTRENKAEHGWADYFMFVTKVS